MKKFSKLIDLKVISEDNSMRLGKISDVLFDTKTLKICAFIISTNSIIPLAKLIKIDDISKIDASSVWVNNKNVVAPAKAMRGIKNIASFQRDVDSTIIIHKSHRMGVISDVLFNAEIGEIAEFEVSDGFVEDVLNGRKSVAIQREINFKDKKIVLNGD